MNQLSISLVQADLVWENKEANLEKQQVLIDDISNSDIIVLPEMFPTGFSMKPEALYEETGGEVLQWMQQVAKEKDAAICGSVIVRENANYFNRLYFVEPSGNVHKYDKRHLFTLAGEEKVYSAGNEHLLVNFRGWKIMPLVCYDLRFPVWCRNTEEADLQIFVANWPERRSEAWKALLKARAIENMCYLAGLNRVGADGNDVMHSGDSGVYDELGEKIGAPAPFKEEVVTITLDRNKMHESRKRFNFLNDRDSFTISK
ncbi:amidohydrolase [Owenweeksia hongkongensis]|uniref:amidohydrolase n=1 Tax=Owenweeksia hongkongensis TaxID=253245 RepID=UPI003A8FA452